MLHKLLLLLDIDFSWVNLFRYHSFRAVLATLTAIACFIFFGKWAIRKLGSLQLKQYIRDDGPKNHQGKAGTPTMGGCIIVSVIIVSVLLWGELKNIYLWLTLYSTFFFGLIGFRDDALKIARKSSEGLSAKGKFLLQCLIALPVAVALYFYPGFDTQLNVPFFKNITPDLGAWYIPFAVFIIVGFSNAVNLTDGLDGLAIGPIIIAFMSYIVFSYLSGNIKFASYLLIPYVPGSGELAVLCGAVVGAGLGFLWFNSYPAQVFMGDVGSLPLGAILGTVAVITKQEITLLIVGGLFVVEALSVIFQVGYFKISGGHRIFRMAPIHHHFELKGWPESKVTVRFWIIAIILTLLSMSTLKLR
ncbi:MAG: phospho-N-acetylmuramoyl-pentapeptide-transferase [Deltaproteobacteria bacterium]|nr:phospho-N-acetylmuramoyl-pentapeptide-transferase [Deltaproteobacteria bacterium]